MDVLRRQFLADAAFSQQQDRCIRLGRAGEVVEAGKKGGRIADHLHVLADQFVRTGDGENGFTQIEFIGWLP